jgi:ferric-dicitrate binding protein FerR (iron transport regulator)
MAQTITPRAAGELAIVGNVLLNGTPAIGGATIFSDSTIKTGEGGATVNLGQGGRIQLAANSEMTVRFTQTNIGGNLTAGTATVSAPAGVAVAVATAEGTAVNGGEAACTMTVDVTCGNTRVAAMKSDAKIVATDKTELVAEGQQASVGQPGAPKCSRLLAATKYEGLSPGALAALIIAGIGGAVAGIIAAAQGDDVTPTTIVVSGFRPTF